MGGAAGAPSCLQVLLLPRGSHLRKSKALVLKGGRCGWLWLERGGRCGWLWLGRGGQLDHGGENGAGKDDTGLQYLRRGPARGGLCGRLSRALGDSRPVSPEELDLPQRLGAVGGRL